MAKIKIVLMWVVGAFLLMFGSLIAGNVQPGLGVSDSGVALALLISFILFLVAGILWISVAVAVKKTHEL